MPGPVEIFSNTLKSSGVAADARLAVACSGGGDSMALTLLAAHWSQTPIVALTVDHGLRADSAKEAQQVGRWLKKRGIGHVTLCWEGKKPTANIQEAARKARYRLMANYCAQHSIAHLLVAHTLEDQAETFLLRLARGSGVDGLCAMTPITTLYGINVVRPLLSVKKSVLLSYLNDCKQPYLNDPSNENTLFDRVRVRQMMPELMKLGLTPERLAATARTMQRAREHLEEETSDYLKRACSFHPEGYAVLQPLQASREIALRALSRIIMSVGGLEVRGRLADLERLHAAMAKPGFKGATLGGCVVKPIKDRMIIFREVRAVEKTAPLPKNKRILWDNRFEMMLTKTPVKLQVGALGQEDWLFCANRYGLENSVPDKRILYALPALRDKDGWLYAAPHLGLWVDGVGCKALFCTPYQQNSV